VESGKPTSVGLSLFKKGFLTKLGIDMAQLKLCVAAPYHSKFSF
jgi:hypothetical protein